MTLAALGNAVGMHGLTVLGAFHIAPDKTLALLGPDEPRFWAEFKRSFEYLDKREEPLDRWSKRVIDALAEGLGAEARYPFGGLPYQPFIDWAIQSGRVWTSPTGLLVHDAAGLFVSFRGALVIPRRLELPERYPSPCEDCAEKPCLSACPAAALDDNGYDVPACHAYLAKGGACLETGCAVRRACPVGRGKRQLAQSAFHMRAFHKG